MIVYHGTNCEVKDPDVSFAKARLDFGKSFYLTTYKRQAEKWAKRKASRARGIPRVNIYTISDDLSEMRLKDFGEADGDWLDFVCACRSGRAIWRSYDVIRGRVADDDVYKTVDAYLSGEMSREEALEELRFVKPNDQIAITNNKAIKKLLTYKRSYVLMGD